MEIDNYRDGRQYILFTTNDAYMRDFALIGPVDCVASNTKEENVKVLDLMQKVTATLNVSASS